MKFIYLWNLFMKFIYLWNLFMKFIYLWNLLMKFICETYLWNLFVKLIYLWNLFMKFIFNIYLFTRLQKNVAFTIPMDAPLSTRCQDCSTYYRVNVTAYCSKKKSVSVDLDVIITAPPNIPVVCCFYLAFTLLLPCFYLVLEFVFRIDYPMLLWNNAKFAFFWWWLLIWARPGKFNKAGLLVASKKIDKLDVIAQY